MPLGNGIHPLIPRFRDQVVTVMFTRNRTFDYISNKPNHLISLIILGPSNIVLLDILGFASFGRKHNNSFCGANQ